MVEEERESKHEESEGSGDECEDEEPSIKCFESSFPSGVENACSDLLHSMVASKDILLWTPRGQLL